MEKTKLFWSKSTEVSHYANAGLVYCRANNIVTLPAPDLSGDKNLRYETTKLRLHLKLCEKFANFFDDLTTFTIELTNEELVQFDKIIASEIDLPILFIGGSKSNGDLVKIEPVTFYLKIVTNFIDGPPFREIYHKNALNSNEILSSERIGTMSIDIEYEVKAK